MSKRNKTAIPTIKSKTLKALRLESGLSIRKLALRLNLSPTRVSQMELGRDEVNEAYLTKFMEVLCIDKSDWNERINSKRLNTSDMRKRCIEFILSIDESCIEDIYRYILMNGPNSSKNVHCKFKKDM